MSLDEMYTLMDEELSRPCENIDTDYVDELVEQILAQPSGALPRASRSTYRSGVVRRVRMALAAVLLMSLLGGAAGAWQWLDISSFFTPVMEQLGIRINISSDESPTEIVKNEGTGPAQPLVIDWDAPIHLDISDPSQLPSSINGYPVLIPNLSQSYQFDSAVLYQDETAAILTTIYTQSENTLFVQMYLSKEPVGNAAWMLENNPYTVHAGNVHVFEDYDRWLAIIPCPLGYYSIWGRIPKEELLSIVEQLKGVIPT